MKQIDDVTVMMTIHCTDPLHITLDIRQGKNEISIPIENTSKLANAICDEGAEGMTSMINLLEALTE